MTQIQINVSKSYHPYKNEIPSVINTKVLGCQAQVYGLES